MIDDADASPAAPALRRNPPWRRWLRAVHRDVGFVCVGLTIAYAVSGIAIDHRSQWDPDRARTRTTTHVGGPGALLAADIPAERREALDADPLSLTRSEETALVGRLTHAMQRSEPPRNTLWRGPERLELYFSSGDADVIHYDLSNGTVTETRTQERFLLRDLNFLHRNERPGLWTFVSDAFATALVFLAVSGLFLTRGPMGLRGRGGWLLAGGVLLPSLYVLWIRYL